MNHASFTVRSSRWGLVAALLVACGALAGCGDGGSGGDGGGDGASGDGCDAEEACDKLWGAIVACVDAWCASEGSATPECGCWRQGLELDVGTCACVPRDQAAYCQEVPVCQVDPSTVTCMGNVADQECAP